MVCCCELEGSDPTCWPGTPCPAGLPLATMLPWAGLKGGSLRRIRLDGDGALSADPGEEGRARFPSMSEGSRCIWPCFCCWSMCIICGLAGVTMSAQGVQDTPTIASAAYLFWLLAMAL